MVECTPPHSIRCEELNKPWYEDKETEITVIVAALIAIVLCVLVYLSCRLRCAKSKAYIAIVESRHPEHERVENDEFWDV